MAEILVDLLQGGHYSFLEELPQRSKSNKLGYEVPKEKKVSEYST